MISVILATYNNEKTIFNSISSILNQNYKNFELIIINDCSSDKTKQIINSFDDKRIVYLENKKNLGRAKSRNIGIKKAKGNYIAVMDGDDISVKERFEIQLKCFEDNPSINLVASNTIFFKDNKVIGVSDAKTNSPKNLNFFFTSHWFTTCHLMVRKEFLRILNIIQIYL